MNKLHTSAIYRLATHYLGEPNLSISKGNQIRFGNNGSKSVDVEKDCWFDFETNIGGGVIDLIKAHEPNVDIASVLRKFGITFDDKAKLSEKVWTYEDENGIPRYQVVRLQQQDGKTYRQRQIAENGTHVWSMIGVTALPYKLPELLQSKETIFIVEGEKCADAVIRLGLTATTNHGGANKWHSSLTPYFKDRNVVIVPDNDEPGRKHADLVASKLSGMAASIRILTLPGLSPKGDIFDWIASGGTKDQLLAFANQAPEYSAQTLPKLDVQLPSTQVMECGLHLVPWSDLSDIEVQWLVDHLIPAHGLTALFGKPGSGKSFVALKLAAAIGSGVTFFGKNVREGDVVYIAGEGGAGLKNRRDALQKFENIQSPKVHFLQSQLDLRSNEADREALISEIERCGLKPALVIIDTLARAFAGGNENASDDMGKFISHVTALQQRLNTAVLIVHHSGKDEARGQRGHSSLNAAIDAEIELQRLSELGDENRYGQMTVTKQKDGEDGLKFFFKLELVQLGVIGASRSSLVVLPVEEQDIVSSSGRKLLKGHTKTAFEALKKAIDEGGEIRSLPNIPSDRPSVTESLWREIFYMMTPSDGGKKPETKQKAFARALKALKDSRTIGYWAELAWISDG